MWLILPTLCLIINTQEIIINKFNIQWLAYFDEAILVTPYIFAPFLIRKKNEIWMYFILALPFISIVYTLIINYTSHPNLLATNAIIQSFINFKLFLYYIIFYSLSKITAFKNNEAFQNTLKLSLLVSILGYIINILHPSLFIYSDAAWHLERNRIAGFQFKPNDLALFLGLACLYAIYMKTSAIRKTLNISILTILIFFSASRTALIFPASVMLITIFRRGNSHYAFSLALLSTLIIALFSNELLSSFIFTETVKNLREFSSIDSSQYIRGIMIYLGTKLSLNYFPIGTGAGNFGTVMSTNSPVYIELGVANSYFFANSIGIYDSNIASILGEYGILGLVLIIALLIKILKHTLPHSKEQRTTIITLILLMAFVQPIFSYQVNSINILTVLFAIRELSLNKATA